MTSKKPVNYGPLTPLIGHWAGEKGLDVSPEPDGTDREAYYESIEFQAAGDVDNAEEQELAIIRYVQKVFRARDNKHFHDQVGYYTWEAEADTIVHSFVIPRGVGIIAGGKVNSSEGSAARVELRAADADPDWGIVQAPFMRDKARTISFEQTLEFNTDTLRYEQTMLLDIYGREFEHTDSSELKRSR